MKRVFQNRRVYLVSNNKANIVAANRGLTGNYVLKAVSKGMVTKEALEAARKAIKRVIKKNGQLLTRGKAFLPITSKPSEVRMGKGKGKISNYVYPAKVGSILFEIRCCEKGLAIKALLRAGVKLGIFTAVEPLKDAFSRQPILIK